MISALLFILTSAFFGFQLAKRFELFDTTARRLAIGFLVGFTLQTFLILAISWGLGSLSEPVIYLSALVFSLAGAVLQKNAVEKPERWRNGKGAVQAFSRNDLVAIAFAFLFLVLNVFSAMHVTKTGFESVPGVWGDYPFHLSVATSFTERANFPPKYSILVGEPLKYSFAFDFTSAILMKGGLDYWISFILPNVLTFLAFSLAAVILIELLANRRKGLLFVCFIAFALFFFNGNYGIAQALSDSITQKSLAPLYSPSLNYSNVDSLNVVLMNFVYSILLPARSALLGLALSVLIYALLYSSVVDGKWRKKELLLAGVLTGLLPLAHAQSLLVVGIVAAFLMVLNLRKEWAYFIIPAGALCFPQVVWLWGKAQFKLQLGWMAKEKTLWGAVEFWLKNGWGLLLCFIAWLAFAVKNNERKLLSFATPFLVVLVLATLAVFQPWEWDNTKLFMHVFFIASIASAFFLESLYNSLRKPKLAKAVVVLIFVISIASGVLAVEWMLWGSNARFETFSNDDFKLAGWVKLNTPSDSIFSSTQFHQNPVASLAGRQLMAGYEGWLWSHGFKYEPRLSDAKRMWEFADCGLMRSYGVSYVYTRGYEFQNSTVFKNKPNDFEMVYEDFRGNRLFKLKCSK